MNIIPCSQGSADWFTARAGKVTASNVAAALAFLKRGDKKGGETAARAAYKAKIVAETLRGEPLMEGFVSSYMEYGTEMEPFARGDYEAFCDISVDQVGFVVHPKLERFGCSPDGLIGTDGGGEFKCPKTETHLEYMLAGIVPPEYEPQVMSCLACTEREWWDFMSFDDRLPYRHKRFIKRMYRDEKRIAEIEDGVRIFLQDVDDMIGQIEALNPEVEPIAEPVEDSGELGVTDADINDWYASHGIER
jgi:hypothetical protein